MPDYKKLYHTMLRAFEQANRLLISAQQVCEELYLSSKDVEILLVLNNKNVDEQ